MAKRTRTKPQATPAQEIEILRAENTALTQVMKDQQERSRVETDEWVQRCGYWKDRFTALSDAIVGMSNVGMSIQAQDIMLKPFEPRPQSFKSMSDADQSNVPN